SDITRSAPDLVLTLVVLGEADKVEHRRSDRAGRAEDVERHAGADAVKSWLADAAGERAKGLLDVEGIDVAVHGLVGLVEAPDAVDVPVPFATEAPVERGGRVIGVDLLFEVARSRLDHAALDLAVVAARASILRNQVDPKRIERIASGDRDMVEQIAVAHVGPDSERDRCRLVDRVSPIPNPHYLEVRVGADLLRDVGEGAVPLQRDFDKVEWRKIEAIGICEAPEIGREARLRR